MNPDTDAESTREAVAAIVNGDNAKQLLDRMKKRLELQSRLRPMRWVNGLTIAVSYLVSVSVRKYLTNCGSDFEVASAIGLLCFFALAMLGYSIQTERRLNAAIDLISMDQEERGKS